MLCLPFYTDNDETQNEKMNQGPMIVLSDSSGSKQDMDKTTTEARGSFPHCCEILRPHGTVHDHLYPEELHIEIKAFNTDI